MLNVRFIQRSLKITNCLPPSGLPFKFISNIARSSSPDFSHHLSKPLGYFTASKFPLSLPKPMCGACWKALDISHVSRTIALPTPSALAILEASNDGVAAKVFLKCTSFCIAYLCPCMIVLIFALSNSPVGSVFAVGTYLLGTINCGVIPSTFSIDLGTSCRKTSSESKAASSFTKASTQAFTCSDAKASQIVFTFGMAVSAFFATLANTSGLSRFLHFRFSFILFIK